MSGVGVFTNSLTGLTPHTTYYFRAYATNSMGTAYGEEVTFTTSDLDTNEVLVGPLFEFREINGTESIRSIEANPGEPSMFEMYIRKNDQDENTKVFVEFQICKDGIPMSNAELASTMDNYMVVGMYGDTSSFNSNYSFEFPRNGMSYTASSIYNDASGSFPQSNLGLSNSIQFDWFWLHFLSDRKITVNLGAWKPGSDGVYTIHYAVVVAGDNSDEFMYVYEDGKRIGGTNSHLNLTVKDTIAYDYITIYVGDTTSSPIAGGQPCPGIPTVIDIDGNVYNTVQIGGHCWMKENLRSKHFQKNMGGVPELTLLLSWR